MKALLIGIAAAVTATASQADDWVTSVHSAEQGVAVDLQSFIRKDDQVRLRTIKSLDKTGDDGAGKYAIAYYIIDCSAHTFSAPLVNIYHLNQVSPVRVSNAHPMPIITDTLSSDLFELSCLGKRTGITSLKGDAPAVAAELRSEAQIKGH
jgi:hypothetical protein